jgi:hydroxymethylglutaryl-CoA lyase
VNTITKPSAITNMTDRVTLTDVGPRDGLQNQPRILEAGQRLQLIDAIIAAGVPCVEVTSFVSPKAVPAMAGAGEVVAGLREGAAHYSALALNRKGYDLATQSGISTIGVAIASTRTMNEKNINSSTEKALAMFGELVSAAKTDGVKTIACVATAWECPFEGLVDADKTLAVARQMMSFGADELSLADTIGAANPASVKALTQLAVQEFGAERINCHFHDTRGMGVANVAAALETGVRKFDASIGGLGGCPFAPGATGNVATEDVALMCGQMGFETGINIMKLVHAVDVAIELTGNCEGGHSLRWLRRQIEKGTLG